MVIPEGEERCTPIIKWLTHDSYSSSPGWQSLGILDCLILSILLGIGTTMIF